MRTTPTTLEAPPPGEAGAIRAIAERLKARIIKDNTDGTMRRDAHPKMHGLVRAEFIIEPDLPPALRIGVFREPRTYPAWIRFSNQNGRIRPDCERDIRGMAIKLIGVEGEKLLEDERDAQTQDFILISTPVFVTKDVEEFGELLKALDGRLLVQAWFFLTHWRVAWNVLRSLEKFASPLQIRYSSTTPYLWGDTAAKYSAIPGITELAVIPKDPEDDFLRTGMVRRLEGSSARFDFVVQLRTNPATMPIEDPSRLWGEDESPLRKVASIVIPKQNFDSDAQRMFGEGLSFSPWHSLPEHRPLGGINRARKEAYAFISSFRHEKNKVPRKEPTSLEF